MKDRKKEKMGRGKKERKDKKEEKRVKGERERREEDRREEKKKTKCHGARAAGICKSAQTLCKT